LFAYVSGSQVWTITQAEFVSFLRQMIKDSGFQQDIFSRHSLRRGGGPPEPFFLGVFGVD